MAYVVLTLCFWGLVGYTLMLPVMLVQAIFNAAKVGGLYDARGDYRSKRYHHMREVKFYGLANLSIIVLLLSFIR